VLDVPAHLTPVRYDGARDPGAADSAELTEGANCQLFAYALLLHFGRSVPPLRSSDLRENARHTRRVADLLPLDLLLWNHTAGTPTSLGR